MIYGLWAKTNPYKSLMHHMIDAGNMSKYLLEKSNMSPILAKLRELIPEDNVIDLVSFLIALHDIGKCHPYFQGLYPSDFIIKLNRDGKLSIRQHYDYRHEIGSKIIIEQILKEKKYPPKLIRAVGSALRLHHQKGFQDLRNCRVPENMDKQFWETQHRAIFAKLEEIFTPRIELLQECKNIDAFSVLLWGLTVLSDWLCSGQDEFYSIDNSLSLESYVEKSHLAALHSIELSGLSAEKSLPATDFNILWKVFNNIELRPLQKTCVNLSLEWRDGGETPGFALLEAPMGEGKTEAGVFFASHMMQAFNKTGLYIALPTAATSNNMYSRIEQLLSSHGISSAKLMHSQAWLWEGSSNYVGETEDHEDAEAWLAPLRKGMLSQYAIGTVDQAMMAVMRIRYGVLRLIGSAAKAIIIDEVHAYDSYMLAIIERLLSWCAALSIPVVMLSATLPIERRNRLLSAYSGKQANSSSMAYPLVTCSTAEGIVREIPVEGTFMQREVALELKPMLGKWELVAKYAKEQILDGGCLCIIVNTVKEAQALYRCLESEISGDVKLRLFHARFTAARRQKIEAECLSLFGKDGIRPRASILVATQVVEQSLDLDFDMLITAVAPIDLLLQRIGRLHRHGGRERPKNMKHPRTVVLLPEGDVAETPSSLVYHPWILNKTIHILSTNLHLMLPNDIRLLVEAVYGTKPQMSDEQYMDWVNLTIQNDTLHETAQPVLYPTPKREYFFAAENEGYFFEEQSEDISYIGARTRMGGESVRIAIISPDIALKAEHPDKKIAQYIMSQTVAVPHRYLKERERHPDYAAEIICHGLLSGIILFPSESKEYAFRANRKTMVLFVDNVLGLTIKEVG